MALKSRLFAGDKKLEAAATSNPAHVTPGAVGPHVEKIQCAVIRLDGATIDIGELREGRYGTSTAAAVLAYKQKRGIINRSYQSQADNIVGIMTIARLDAEMVAFEAKPVTVRDIQCQCGRPADEHVPPRAPFPRIMRPSFLFGR